MASPSTTSTEATPASGESVAGLLQKLTEQTSTLAQKEVELAKAEMALKGRKIGVGAGAFSAAGLLAVLAIAGLTAAAILALATVVEDWLAATIVSSVYLLAAGALALIGRSKVEEGAPPVPEQTLQSVKEDARRTKQKAKEGRA